MKVILRIVGYAGAGVIITAVSIVDGVFGLGALGLALVIAAILETCIHY